MATLLINGYLMKGVIDNKHKSARITNSYLRGVIKAAGGTAKKLEVLSGTIFISLKDEKGVVEVKNALAMLEGVEISEPNEAQLIYVRERARSQAKAVENIAA